MISASNLRCKHGWLLLLLGFFSKSWSFPTTSVRFKKQRVLRDSNNLLTRSSYTLALSKKEEQPLSLEKDQVRPHRTRQKRAKAARRRPDYYWSDPNNLKAELIAFWTDQGVPLPKNKAPPIPNEVLLRHYQRNDLRGALAKYGGRELVSELLGGCSILPGRWKDAFNESPELRTLVEKDATLSADRPPLLKRPESSGWKHQDGRKPMGYWNKTTLLKEIYAYVAEYRQTHQRPAVWMPRPSEFGKEGRDDIRQALNRLGGPAMICRLAGMVPFQEWYYFDGQLELLMELQRYLKEHGNGATNTFPVVEEVRRNGYDQLHSLILYYGGRRFLAARLGMNTMGNSDLNFGPFSLDFAVRLMSFIRRRQLQKNPPLTNPTIAIPSPSQLAGSKDLEAAYLHEMITRFGGSENVARRLGLAFHSTIGDIAR